ncbi:hypothetical protein ACVWYN_002706 [Pedobacter sp. UYP24]
MISNFPTKKLSNLGGLKGFKFIPSFHISVAPPISEGVITSAIVLQPGKSWLNGYATPETLEYNEEAKDSDNGVIFTCHLSGFVPGDFPELNSLLNTMAGLPFCVQFYNAKNELRIAGTQGQPLIFSYTFKSGSARSDSKGYQFEFLGESICSAPAYNI